MIGQIYSGRYFPMVGKKLDILSDRMFPNYFVSGRNIGFWVFSERGEPGQEMQQVQHG